MYSVPQDLLVPLEHKELKVIQVLLVRLGLKELKVLQDLLVPLGHKELKDKQEQRDKRDQLVNQVLLVPLDKREPL